MLITVIKVWPLKMYNVPTYTVDWVAGDDATAESSNGESAATRQAATDTFSPHVMTQVNKLRDEGEVGAGIKVAVVDTGVSSKTARCFQLRIRMADVFTQVDYLHPALGGCFGEGCLVSFGYDLVGDDYTGGNTPVPDDDPFDCEGHGTVRYPQNEYIGSYKSAQN